MKLSILGDYLLTDTEAPNVDGHHPWPASHDFHPRNGENVLLEDSEGMQLEVIYANGLSGLSNLCLWYIVYLEFKC